MKTTDDQDNSIYTNWKSVPGGFDALNTIHLYEADNELEIPQLPQAPLNFVPDWLAPYRTRIRSEKGISDGGLHFFLHDYRFESVWRRPVKTLSRVARWEVVLTPDFSLYYDCPRIMQMWNVYRSRWVGRWWVENGIKVIPTVSWGLHDSHDFCFLGLPERSVLAVSTVGTKKDPSLKVPYLAGFRKMVTRLEPTVVLCYGRPYPEMLNMVELKIYPDYWRGVAAARRRYGNEWDNARIDIDKNADEDNEFDFDF